MRKTATLILASLALCATEAMAQTEVTFYTTMGSFVVELTDTKTPITVDSFLARTTEGFYDGVTFHRVIDGFMIQGGDPTGTGSGNPGYTIPDEFDASLSNVQGTISMANTGAANSGGCQFFINLVDNTFLDFNKAPTSSKHAVFGSVTTNFSVVQAIGKVATDANDRPTTPVVMDSVRITKFPTSIKAANKLTEVASIYPNPSTDGKFTIDINNPNITTRIMVTDVAGKLITKLEIAQQTQANIDLSSQPKGVYLIQLSNTDGVLSNKVTIR